jgi:hypothetical protein
LFLGLFAIWVSSVSLPMFTTWPTLTEAQGLRRIFTLDSHFHAYRTSRGQALTIVPGT